MSEDFVIRRVLYTIPFKRMEWKPFTNVSRVDYAFWSSQPLGENIPNQPAFLSTGRLYPPYLLSQIRQKPSSKQIKIRFSITYSISNVDINKCTCNSQGITFYFTNMATSTAGKYSNRLFTFSYSTISRNNISQLGKSSKLANRCSQITHVKFNLC